MKPDFIVNYTKKEREDLIMPEIIRCLRALGGFAARKQIVKEMRETSKIIPEDYIDYVETSKKTGNEYKRFDFQFNFSVKHLLYADFVKIPHRGDLELTEKGRNIDLKIFDSQEMVRSISRPLWEENSRKNKEIREDIVISDNSEEEMELENVNNENWKIELSKALKAFSPQKFELFSRRLVSAMGVDIDESIGIQRVADGGIDGFGYITSGDFRTTRVAIQAKRWEGKVSSPEIDKFRGAMDKYNSEFGIFITTSDFTRNAIEASRIGSRVITLINGEEIADLVAKYGHKMDITPITTYELGEFYQEDN
ncbi:MAG: Mrr restriction system protein [Defluviitaleaceae bacterium]|nr:Mrr restriction system protein [Defluviitaleaceae bacterium]